MKDRKNRPVFVDGAKVQEAFAASLGREPTEQENESARAAWAIQVDALACGRKVKRTAELVREQGGELSPLTEEILGVSPGGQHSN